jgi:hypothetical protein
VISLVALFVALSGTALAVGVVPLAKRALTADNAKVANLAKQAAVADNAKKVGGRDLKGLVEQAVSQASQAPGPASTAAGLITVKIAPWSLSPGGEGDFTATCDPGQKAIAGGWADPGNWSTSYQSLPTGDGSGWTTHIWTYSGALSGQSGSVYAICLK